MLGLGGDIIVIVEVRFSVESKMQKLNAKRNLGTKRLPSSRGNFRFCSTFGELLAQQINFLTKSMYVWQCYNKKNQGYVSRLITDIFEVSVHTGKQIQIKSVHWLYDRRQSVLYISFRSRHN